MSSISSRIQARKYAIFELLVSLSQIFGFSMIILSGYVFNTIGTGIVWPTRGDPNSYSLKNFHGFFMITGLVFFQGEALLSYRLYRHEAKVLSKFIHVVFHLLAMAFFTTALAVVIIQKNLAQQRHFASVHSWIGVSVMFVYTVQFLFGALNFLIPGISLKLKQAFMPFHRAVGCISFLACTIQAIIGHTEYIMLYANGPSTYGGGCYWLLDCTTKLDLIYNFSLIAMILYCISVLVVVVPVPWRRQKTLDEME